MALYTSSTERVLSGFMRQHLHAGPARLARRELALGRAPQGRAQAVRPFFLHSPSQTCRTMPTLSCMRAVARPFSSTSQTSDSANPSTSFPDPERPDLFYHLFEPPTDISHTSPVFALSFLSTPPPYVRSCTVIGWLPASAPGEKEEGAGLNDFVENRTPAPLFCVRQTSSLSRLYQHHFGMYCTRRSRARSATVQTKSRRTVRSRPKSAGCTYMVRVLGLGRMVAC